MNSSLLLNNTHMSLSSFSLVLGVFFYVFGFPLVFCNLEYAEWRKKIMNDTNTVRIIGMAFAMIAVTTLRGQWRISGDGEGLIVAFAWIVLAKSLAMAWWPGHYEKFHQMIEGRFMDIPAVSVFLGAVMVLLGAFFTYFGILLPQ